MPSVRSIQKLTPQQVQQLTVPELKAGIKSMRDAINKRQKRLQSDAVAASGAMVLEQYGGDIALNMSTAGKDRNALLHTYAEMRHFSAQKQSTLRGFQQTRASVIEHVRPTKARKSKKGEQYEDVFDLSAFDKFPLVEPGEFIGGTLDRERKFWKLVKKYKKGMPLKDIDKRIGQTVSDVIVQIVYKYFNKYKTKRAQERWIKMEIDSLYENLENEMVKEDDDANFYKPKKKTGGKGLYAR